MMPRGERRRDHRDLDQFANGTNDEALGGNDEGGPWVPPGVDPNAPSWETMWDAGPVATGGLTALFSALASGQRTPYELSTGRSWQEMADQPVSAEDEAYYDDLVAYQKGPFRNQAEIEALYRSMTNSGYAPAEAAAIIGENQGAVRSTFDRARDAAERRSGLTGNTAGYYATLGRMAREEASALGDAATKTQRVLADEKQRRKETGTRGLLDTSSASEARTARGMAARGDFLNNVFGRKATALKGAQDWSGQGRALQTEGARGLGDLLRSDTQTTNMYMGGLLDLLKTKRDTRNDATTLKKNASLSI